MEAEENRSLIRMLRQNPHLADAARKLAWQPGEEIGRAGDPCGHFLVLECGQVVLSRQAAEGRQRTVALLGPGDLFGEEALQGEGEWRHSAHALTGVTVYAIPAHLLPTLTRHFPELNSGIIGGLLGRLEAAHRRLELLDHQGIQARVVALLQLLARRNAAADGPFLLLPPLTQEQLGEMLGVARETVARTMAQLEREGTIRRRGRSRWLRHPVSLAGAFLVVLARLTTGPALYVAEEDFSTPRGRRGRVVKAAGKITVPIGATGKL